MTETVATPPKADLTSTVLTIAVVVSLILCVYFGFQRRANLATIEARTPGLDLLTNFNTDKLKTDKATSNYYPNRRSINDIVDAGEELKLEQDRYRIYLENLQAPYHNFLQYLILPSLNVWKNNYTENIDVTLMGPKFLENNPYMKLSLIEKWSNFFRDVGDTSQFNEITDITVNNIVADGEFFRIPITLSFTSPSKRSFLLLVEKLGMTSSKDNISLMNEFLYNLFEEIKNDKKDIIENKIFPGAMSGVQTMDRKIGYLVYNLIINNDDNKIIDDALIEKAIQKSAGCNKAKTDKCYYLFREKYRTIPYFAYTIADKGIDKTAAMREFFKKLPPVMQIKEFTFEQSRTAQVLQEGNSYEGKISIELIGRDVSEQEVKDIATILGNVCFQDAKKPMSVDASIKAVADYMVKLSHLTADNVTKGQELADLKIILEEMQGRYKGLSNYKKSIKLFEMYRMLYDSSVCKL